MANQMILQHRIHITLVLNSIPNAGRVDDDNRS